MTPENGNGEKRTLKRLLSIAIGIVAAFFTVIAALIGVMWGNLAAGQAANAERISENRERIIRLELLDELRSSGRLREE